MAKGMRYSSRSSNRRSSTFTLVLAMLLILSFVLLMMLALGILSLPVHNSEIPKVNDLSSVARESVKNDLSSVARESVKNDLSSVARESVKKRNSDGLGERRDQWMEVISWEPRAYVYHNFLSEEECKYLIDLAKPHMEKSTVVDSETGKSKDSRVRTSSGTFLKRGQDKIIRSIEKRIADFTFIPETHGEGLQILHYEVGQKYEPHYDYFLDDFNTKNGGQRIATVLMYLSEVEEGGETVFPAAKGNISSVPWWNELSECGKKGLSVKPKMGDALLFWSMRPDASLDPSSLHGGCPVISGNKWSSTKWIRVDEYKV